MGKVLTAPAQAHAPQAPTYASLYAAGQHDAAEAAASAGGATNPLIPLPNPVLAAPIEIAGTIVSFPTHLIDASIETASLAPTAPVTSADESDATRQGRDPAEMLQFGEMRVPRAIVETILQAAETTQVDPAYLMALADKESSFLVDSKSTTSSAEGLFQFIASTWLEVVRAFGPQHGLAAQAAAIQSSNGQLSVPDEEMREQILALRRDPLLSALMAAEMMKRDRAEMERRLGRAINRSEFYFSHFFGVDGASKFISLVDGKPKQSAPRVFPEAARANRNLFFTKRGRKTRHLTVGEVYDRIDAMIDKRLDRYEDVEVVASL